jgi:hypothetical protein
LSDNNAHWMRWKCLAPGTDAAGVEGGSTNRQMQKSAAWKFHGTLPSGFYSRTLATNGRCDEGVADELSCNEVRAIAAMKKELTREFWTV